MKTQLYCLFLFIGFFTGPLFAQDFYFGADLSYVNEMEDCGVIYTEKGVTKDPYQIFADNNCNLVRLRLWHTPAWYDTLNQHHRYSDFQDVKKSISRAKALEMKVLLDFHLSDTWADPSHQVAPQAWQPIVNNLPVLKDSLYHYISKVLLALNQENLLPEMVQIGNETNKGILLSNAVDANGWSLDWNRNSQLFNTAIKAVRDVEQQTGKSIKIGLHIAGPADSNWLLKGFWDNGVRDFDIIGLSYYWAWHKPTTIEAAGDTVAQLLQRYPGKEVLIFETGYIWTTASNDNANNIINNVHPDYAPASPENQKRWLIDLAQKVIDKGGKGIIYWEPAWVSSTCRTPWGQGSHQEHATFFDFNNNVLTNGGMDWMSYNYNHLVATSTLPKPLVLKVFPDSTHRNLILEMEKEISKEDVMIRLMDSNGKIVFHKKLVSAKQQQVALPSLSSGVYFALIYQHNKLIARKKVFLKSY